MTSSRLALLVTAAAGLMAYSVWSGDIVLPMVPPFDAAKNDAAAPRQAPAAADAPLARPVAALNPLSGLGAETFAAIVERPLFNPTRRPAPPPAPEVEPVVELPDEPPPAVVAEPEVKPEDFSLLAITAVDGTATALVRWNPTNQVYQVKQGQPVSDWQLVKIGALDVTLGRDGKTLQLKLFQNFGPAPPSGVPQINPPGGQLPPGDESGLEPPPQPVSPPHN